MGYVPIYTEKSYRLLLAARARKAPDRLNDEKELHAIFKELTKLRGEYDSLKITKTDEREQAKIVYQNKRKKLYEKRDAEISRKLSSIENTVREQIDNDTFSWDLQVGPKIGDRQTYSTGKGLNLFCVSEQIRFIIHRNMQPHLTDRNRIIMSLQEALQRQYSFGIYKTDIRHFYDSIPQELLIQKLRTSNIDKTTISLIQKLLNEFRIITNKSIGIPQGTAISSVLAEFYLSQFDLEIRLFPDVLFYSRYVDDIILITTKESLKTIQTHILSEMQKIRLSINQDKTKTIITANNGEFHNDTYPEKDDHFEYLGYEFSTRENKLITELSYKRKARIEHKLDKAFDTWNKRNEQFTDNSRLVEKDSNNGLLIQRLRFLTGNCRLHNAKSNVLVGIYFSNQSLSADYKQLKGFDSRLKALAQKNKERLPEHLFTMINQLSFCDGFIKRKYYSFTTKELERISACWKEH